MSQEEVFCNSRRANNLSFVLHVLDNNRMFEGPLFL